MQKTLSVIDLSAIRHNALYVRKLVGNRFFFAVVKADAYGHGAETLSREMEDIVDGFCVAIVEEGVRLRVAGVSKPILVLAPPLSADDAARLAYYDLIATVCDERSARLSRGIYCHIAVNTGMNRYGCRGEELDKVLSIVAGERILGAYSHLYAADSANICKTQLAEFLAQAKKIKARSPDAMLHISASGGILRGGEYLLDGVRCGLMLYGYPPAGFICTKLIPALKVYARLAQATKPFGGGVGYNAAEREYKNLYTYRLGYADGFARGVPLGEKTLCMDAFISQEKCELMPVLEDAAEYAARCGTIPYEVLCSVTRRSERLYEKRFKV